MTAAAAVMAYRSDSGSGVGHVIDFVLHAIIRGAVYRVLFGLPLGLVAVVALVAMVVLSARRRRRRPGRA